GRQHQENVHGAGRQSVFPSTGHSTQAPTTSRYLSGKTSVGTPCVMSRVGVIAGHAFPSDHNGVHAPDPVLHGYGSETRRLSGQFPAQATHLWWRTHGGRKDP